MEDGSRRGDGAERASNMALQGLWDVPWVMGATDSFKWESYSIEEENGPKMNLGTG